MSVPVTGELLTPSMYAPFAMGNPNGHELENCMAVNVVRGTYSDEECSRELCGFCQLERAPKMQIRGRYQQSSTQVADRPL